jgi:hypothetical protein
MGSVWQGGCINKAGAGIQGLEDEGLVCVGMRVEQNPYQCGGLYNCCVVHGMGVRNAHAWASELACAGSRMLAALCCQQASAAV